MDQLLEFRGRFLDVLRGYSFGGARRLEREVISSIREDFDMVTGCKQRREGGGEGAMVIPWIRKSEGLGKEE